MLAASNLFMTFAWYGHLRPRRSAVVDRRAVSWGIALFEYLLQVPANRIGYTVLSLAQLKILQEVITLAVFVPFAMLFMGADAQARLPVGGPVHDGRRLLHVSRVAPRPPQRFRRMHLHILGICGTFMGGIAAIAGARGHTVTGCDANVYPPMSDAARGARHRADRRLRRGAARQPRAPTCSSSATSSRAAIR